MVSYRFKRDGQYIQRELELDPLDEHQDQVYPESLEEQVDYSAFYDTYYNLSLIHISEPTRPY